MSRNGEKRQGGDHHHSAAPYCPAFRVLCAVRRAAPPPPPTERASDKTFSTIKRMGKQAGPTNRRAAGHNPSIRRRDRHSCGPDPLARPPRAPRPDRPDPDSAARSDHIGLRCGAAQARTRAPTRLGLGLRLGVARAQHGLGSVSDPGSDSARTLTRTRLGEGTSVGVGRLFPL